MMTTSEYEELKTQLAEVDPDELVDILNLSSELLLEIVEFFDPMIIERAGDRMGGPSLNDKGRGYAEVAGRKTKSTMKS